MSARVDFSPSGYGLCNANVTINRACPAILNGHMTETEWKTFCDRVDEVLAKVGPLQQRMVLMFAASGFVMMGGFIAIGVLMSSGAFFANPAIFPVIGFGSVFLFGCCGFGSIIFTAQQGRAIEVDLEKVCNEESARRPNVSIHVRVRFYLRG